MTMNANRDDKKAMERAKNYLYRISAELSLVSGKDTDDQMRIDSARRMAADNALRLEEHLRGF
ncbi:hypothetical protein EAO85_14855 [Salmonella enterica subsp. enterica serovar 4,5,12:b:-]|nr:hypothetical protein [Salmonella enterica]EBH8381988.1 hypothetical protein [Salmonella enterica subsp. enterica serovar 4,5,12:b:-]ECS8963574.1 hypothetical protein [Salmonella enterica subsp. enterica serovar Java]ECT9494485.1 hypothetical protein [Salmonella enterica subsp. enterica serovar 4,[5],12:b:-]EAT3324088.1 hypothetical protein [Salmonella enterica]